jgi:Rps23 Pro-64 3,4-dihydroxylase Tpa1-like proline 4-hydroxylase
MLVDDFYTTKEQFSIWEELEYYRRKNLYSDGKRPDSYGVSPVANLNRIYLEELYPDNRQDSNILTLYKKILSEEVLEKYRQTTPAARQFENTNYDCSVVNYYEDSNNYGEHFDSFMHTVFIWFYKSPKRFEGGNLRFPELNKTVECIHNRMVMFPSYYLHEVDKVKIENKYRDQGLGRYCMTHFYSKV